MLGKRQLACNELDDVDGVDADGLLVVRMKVRSVMLPTSLDEHANDDAVEPRDLWHNGEDTNGVPGDA